MKTSVDENVHFYRGQSMYGTFRQGDYLMVKSLLFADICPGDVIIFRGKNSHDDIVEFVHRVVAITKDGLVARGDNNRYCDPLFIQPEQIIGKVETVKDRCSEKPVVGGVAGLQRARLRWRIIWLDWWFRKIFWKPYFVLRASGVVTWFWRPLISMMRLQTEHGLLVKYIYKQRTVAVWDASQKKFNCRKPFDLVIPHPESSQA